jgi:hypothetical protein
VNSESRFTPYPGGGVLESVHVAAAVVIALPGSDRLAAFTAGWQQHAEHLELPPLHVLEAVELPDRAAGCLASHRGALAALPGPLLVCEDDAVLAPTFRWPLCAPAGWQILWLGGQHRRRPRPVTAGWVTAAGVVRTHCYIAREPGRVAAGLAGAPRIDPFIAELPVAQYAQQPFSVGQRAGRSTITGDIRTADTYFNQGSP